MDNINFINFNFLEQNIEKTYNYTILIILNLPILKEQYLEIRNITDYVICADGAANRLYDLGIEDQLPDCIVGDFDSVRKEVLEYYSNKNVKLLHRNDQDSTDLEKCLYVSIEILSNQQSDSNKPNSIIILGCSGGRVDHTFSIYSNVLKYNNIYNFELKDSHIFLFSRSSISVFLKQGVNKIYSNKYLQNENMDYSLTPLLGEANIEVNELEENINEIRNLKFSDLLFFRKKVKSENIFIKITEDNGVLYSFSTKYHKN